MSSASAAGKVALMARRSPARLLAPLALVGFAFALLLVLNGGGSDGERSAGGDGGSSSPASATATPTSTPRPSTSSKEPRSYTVKPGDTPSAIADETGVSLEEIERLNPDLDPQLLSPGDRIKLRP